MAISIASFGVAITYVIGRTRRTNRIVKTIDRDMKRVIVFPMSLATCILSFATIYWAMLTVVTIARPTIITVSICITWEPIDTAAELLIPLN